MNEPREVISIFRDNWFAVRYHVFDAHVDFEAYEIVAIQDDLQRTPRFPRKHCEGSGDDVTDMVEAETLIKGVVKWDGCCHFTFGDEDGYVHLCGGRSIKNLHTLIDTIYCRAGLLMEESGVHVERDEFRKP